MKINAERLAGGLLSVVAFSALASLLLIALFIFREGLPFMLKIGLRDFLFSPVWNPAVGQFGIAAMIVASLGVTFGAMLIGVPLGIAGAVFMNEFLPRTVMRVIKPAIELLAGIPSVVFGFLGVMVLAPLIRARLGGPGLSLLAAAVILGIMILPTIISVSKSAIEAVPETYLEAGLALGAPKEYSVFKIVVPAAKNGILAGVILGIGRAIGETMAVMMVAGNQPIIPDSILSGVRTLTSNIVLEMGYATDLHREALIGTAVVLFVFILIINLMFSLLKRRSRS